MTAGRDRKGPNDVVDTDAAEQRLDWPGKRSAAGSMAHGGGSPWPGKRSVSGSLQGSPLAIQHKDDPAATPAATPAAAASTSVIVDDNATPTPLQIRRRDFFAKIEPVVKATVSDVLGPIWSAAECMYIDKYLQMYVGRPALDTETFVRRYTGSSARDATQLMIDLAGRVRVGIKQFKETGQLPSDVAAADPAAAAKATATTAAKGVQAKAATTGGGVNDSPEAVMAALGDGTPLDASVATRMGHAFGASFADVRIHTDEGGAAMAQQQGAHAFAVGSHVAFAPGRYNPGSVEGDALLAHELTHVLQQRGATTTGTTSQGAEADADRGAAAAVKNLHGGSAEKASASWETGYQLQRCSGGDIDKGLVASDYKGKFLGLKVASDHTDIASAIPTSLDSEIKAKRCLGAFQTEAAACAAVKANGKTGAVTVEDAKFVAYETDLGFTYRNYNVPDMTGMGGGTSMHPPKLAPGVIVLISNEMMEVRAGQFDPSSKTDQPGTADQHMAASANPFDGYRQALGDDKGDMNGVADKTLLAAFDAALKDTALVVLNKSKAQVAAKQSTYANSGADLSPTELEQMKSTATLLAADDDEIQAAETRLRTYEYLADPDPDAYDTDENKAFYAANKKKAADERKVVEQLKVKRKIHLAKYPLLSRVNPKKFKDLTKEQMAAQLGGELPGILKDIESTKLNVADGSLNLWEVDQVVDATIAGFGLKEGKRKVIEGKRKEKANAKTVSTVIFTVFAIGFGLAAVFATGGTALFFAAGAFGLSTYDAMQQTNQYMIDKPASNVALDKDAGFTAPPGWGWLVVAWIGVGLDGAMVASAVGKIAKAEVTIEQAAKQLAKDVKLGMTEEELIAKLRQAAGDVRSGETITEASRATLSSKLGIPVEIGGPELAGDVRVTKEFDKATGRVTAKSVIAGPQAKIADVLAHEKIINMMNRYEGATGKLRELWDKLLAIVGKGPKDVNPFPPGSKAFDSWYELQKYPELVDAQFAKYKNGIRSNDAKTLATDLEVLEEEARRHQKIVEEMVLEKGGDFIAMSGDSTRAAYKLKYPLVPGASTPEEMLAKGYYYRTAADGKGGFDLVRKTEASGPQLRVVKDSTGALKIVPAVEKLETLITDAAQLGRLRAIVTDDAHLAILYDKVKDATRLENLLKGAGNDAAKLEGLLGKANAADLEKLFKHMTGAELDKFLVDLGDASKLKELAEKFGGDALKHYGGKFFKDFKGVDAETLKHLSTFDGIDKAKGIKGCHDDALFRAEMAKAPAAKAPAGTGLGPIISETPHPSDPSVRRIKYTFWKEDGKGALEIPLTGKAKEFEKTVIKDLNTNTAAWQASANEAIDDSILRLQFPTAADSFSGTSKSGLKWFGHYRDGKIATVFVDF